MLNEILLAIVQGFTEFLPISSSGHLALISNVVSTPNILFFTYLHLASLIAVIIFTRKEIMSLIKFEKKARKILFFLIIASLPAAFFGFFLNSSIERTFSSYLFLSFSFSLTGLILLLTKFSNKNNSVLNFKNSIIIGFAQVLALFPGISRSGITISTGKFLGLSNKEAFKFSFLLFIPISLGAFFFELIETEDYFSFVSFPFFISFLITLLVSLLSLKFLYLVMEKERFWIFGFYCLFMGILSFLIYVI